MSAAVAPEDEFILDTDVGSGPSGPPPLEYDGQTTTIDGLPTRADLVRRSDTKNLTEKLEAQLATGKPIFFMPVDTYEHHEYVGGLPVYRLHLFGCLPNGAKAHVILTGIEVFFDVRVAGADRPTAKASRDFEAHLRQCLFDRQIELADVEDVQAYPVRGYHTDKVAWKRLHFSGTQARKKAIDLVRSLEYETASDDLANYYRMVARVYGLVLTDWGSLTGYEYYRGGAHVDGPSADRSAPQSPLCEHVFRVDVKNFKPLVDPMSPKDVQEKRSAIKQNNPNLSRDRTLVMGWDIETDSTLRSGDVPRAANPTDHVFMVCVSVHWKDDPAPLHSVCLVDVPTEPDSRWTTVVCGSEENVIKGLAVVYRHFAPDIQAGFNDGDYDWPFIIEKARQYSCLSFMVNTMSAFPGRQRPTEEGAYKWNVSKQREIKISAEEVMKTTFLKVPGSIPVDVRIMFKQLFPKSEVGKGSSLNFYLKKCQLPSKADMPYKRMWDIHAAQDADQMRHVAHYCVIDAKRCQELLIKRNVINDRREVSALSYVSLYDAIYYANGHKVCNMLIAYAIRRDILCSSIGNRNGEHGKYPGAWVFHPEKGMVPDPTAVDVRRLEAAREEYLRLKASGDPEIRAELAAAEARVQAALETYHPGRPVTGLDFASLYPSIIMAYNLSPEKFVEDADYARELVAQGKDLYHSIFQFNGRTVQGWFVRHNCVKDAYGLYPSILIDLFEKRSLMKRKMGEEHDYIEHMNLIRAKAAKAKETAPDASPDKLFKELISSDIASITQTVHRLEALDQRTPQDEFALGKTRRLAAFLGPIISAPEPIVAFTTAYNNCEFNHAGIDSKQKALKVYMNTFYGETGHDISPFFLLQLAGGVTTAGQYNIKKVADFVTGKGFRLKYGDTDSLYLTPPEEVFNGVDRRYAFGEITKEQYWTEMVRITMAELDSLRAQVNAYLKADNGTPHLTMAYEEVIYPGVFAGKKKYFGIGHVNVPNFRPKELFIRGIDVVKQGQTELARAIGYRVMWEAVSLDNTKGMVEIVETVLRDAIENFSQWNFEDFVRTDAWKPHKDNKTVQRFMARMKLRVAEEAAENKRRIERGEAPQKALYYIPDPGERFGYVITQPKATFSIRGTKIAPKLGDIIEYAGVATALKIPIDVGQYLKRYVVGLCARFINYDPRFQAGDAVDQKLQDTKSQAAAKKYLETFVAGLQNADPKTLQMRGYAYKRAWKQASKVCSDVLRAQMGVAAEILQQMLPDDADESADLASIVQKLCSDAKKFAEDSFDAAGYAAAYAEEVQIGEDGSDLGGPAPGAPANAITTAYNLYQISEMFAAPSRTRPLSLRMAVLSAANRYEAAARERLMAILPEVADTAVEYEHYLSLAVDAWRHREHADHPETLGEYRTDRVGGAAPPPFRLGEKEIAAFKTLRNTWLELVGVYRLYAQHFAIGAHLAALKARRQKYIAPPDKATINKTLARSADNLPPLGLRTIGNGGY